MADEVEVGVGVERRGVQEDEPCVWAKVGLKNES